MRRHVHKPYAEGYNGLGMGLFYGWELRDGMSTIVTIPRLRIINFS